MLSLHLVCKLKILQQFHTVKFGNFRQGFSFVKIKSSRHGEITLSFPDLGKSCPTCNFLALKICLLLLLAKINFLRKFPDLQ